jgi:hypothetical protein
MDSWWPQRRVYGADHDDPDPGPRDRHEYVELSGGPPVGLFLDVTGIPEAERDYGMVPDTEIGRYEAGGRACYGPTLTRLWEGDAP